MAKRRINASVIGSNKSRLCGSPQKEHVAFDPFAFAPVSGVGLIHVMPFVL
jgi:hypothetical protein